MSWLIPRDELSAEQIRAIELGRGEHRVILGAPGSGKTQILLHRARYLCDEHGVPPDRLHIFVFTNVLKQYIRAALSDLNIDEERVSTLDEWCVQFHRDNIKGRMPRDEHQRRPDYPAIRRTVLNKLAGSAHRFDFVLVDEGQDLDTESFELLKAVGSHVTVCMDHKQQIYDRGSTESQIVKSLGLRRSSLTLLDAFRCCPYIVRVAAEFITDEAERAAFLNQSRTDQTEVQTPLLYEAADFEDEKGRLIGILRERQLVDKSIAILFHLNRQVEGFASALRSEVSASVRDVAAS